MGLIKHRKLVLLFSLVLLSLSSILLITGSNLLTIPILKNPYIPFGNLITWLGLIALPLSIYLGFRRLYHPQAVVYKILGKVLVAFIILSLIWAPVCYALAGNFSFSFSEKKVFQGGQTALRIFWYLNYFLVGGSLFILLLLGLLTIILKRSK